MPRWRKRVARPLNFDEEDVLYWGGICVCRHGEDVDAMIERIFGGWQGARDCWALHRLEVEALDPRPGQRVWGWWQFAAPLTGPQPREVPLPEEQARLLERWKRIGPRERRAIEAERSRGQETA